MSPFSPLYYIKQNKSRCILLMLMLMLSSVIYVGGLYVTGPPSTFESLAYTNDHCVYMIDVSGAKKRESHMDEFMAEVKADETLDYIYYAPNMAYFNWDTVMNFTCSSNHMTFGSVEDFKKHCEYLDIEVDYSKLKTGSLVLSELLAKNLGLELGDTIDEFEKSELYNVYEGYTLTVDYITDQDGYAAYMISDRTSDKAIYLYGKTITGDALRAKAMTLGAKYDIFVGGTTMEDIDSQFSAFYFIFSFIVILVSVIIAITINTAFAGMYQKRNYEIAVYRAIGISKKKILRKLAMELIISDIIAVVIGGSVTMLFLYLFNNLALYPKGLYLNYFHPLALAGVLICNLVSLVPLILCRVKQIKKADITEY